VLLTDVLTYNFHLIADYARGYLCRLHALVQARRFVHLPNMHVTLRDLHASPQTRSAFTQIIGRYPSTEWSRDKWNSWTNSVCNIVKDPKIALDIHELKYAQRLFSVLETLFPDEKNSNFFHLAYPHGKLIKLTDFDKRQSTNLNPIKSIEAKYLHESTAGEEGEFNAADYDISDAEFESLRLSLLTKSAAERAIQFRSAEEQVQAIYAAFADKEDELEKANDPRLNVDSDCEMSTANVSGEFAIAPLKKLKYDLKVKHLTTHCPVHTRLALNVEDGKCKRCEDDKIPRCTIHQQTKLSSKGVCLVCALLDTLDKRRVQREAAEAKAKPAVAAAAAVADGSTTETDVETNERYVRLWTQPEPRTAPFDPDATETEREENAAIIDAIVAEPCIPKCAIHTRTILLSSGVCPTCKALKEASKEEKAPAVKEEEELNSTQPDEPESGAACTITRAKSAVPAGIVIDLVWDDSDDEAIQDSQGVIHID